MAKARLRLVTPNHCKSNNCPETAAQQGPSEMGLTEAEVERLIKATQDNRYSHRDATMVLVAYRHGLRATELVDLRWGAD
jgi:site-specific recombinase XerD